MRYLRFGLLVVVPLLLLSTAALADSETFTIGNPGDYTSVYQVLNGGSNSSVDFFLYDNSGISQWGGDGTGTANSVTASFNLDSSLNPVTSEGTVTFTLNLNGTISASLIDSGGTITGFGYNSLVPDLPESNFSPLLPSNPYGWIDSFGYQASGYLAGTTPSTPEPGTLLMLGTGVLGLGGLVRRKLML